jgi:hypothetical protein
MVLILLHRNPRHGYQPARVDLESLKIERNTAERNGRPAINTRHRCAIKQLLSKQQYHNQYLTKLYCKIVEN